MNKKTLLVGIVLAIIAVGLYFLADRNNRHSDTPKIGVILPLTGEASVYGEAIKNGIELAAEQARQSGGPAIELVYEDDQGSPQRSVSAATKLLDTTKPAAVIGGAMSSTAEAIVPLFNERKAILLSPTATKPSLTSEGGYFFRLWPSDNYDGKFMAEAAWNRLKLKSVGIVFINTAYGKGITDVFVSEYSKMGGKVAFIESYQQGATDFRAIIEKAKTASPEALFLPGYVAEISRFLPQVRQANLQCRILGVNSLYDKKLVELAGEAAEGAVFSYPEFDTESDIPEIRNFVSDYKAKYNSLPDAFAAQGYDAYRVISNAIASTNSITGPLRRDNLLDLPTVSGPGGSNKFLSTGDVEKRLRLILVKGKEFVTLMP